MTDYLAYYEPPCSITAGHAYQRQGEYKLTYATDTSPVSGSVLAKVPKTVVEVCLYCGHRRERIEQEAP